MPTSAVAQRRAGNIPRQISFNYGQKHAERELRSTKGGEHSPPNPAGHAISYGIVHGRSTKGGEHSPPNQPHGRPASPMAGHAQRRAGNIPRQISVELCLLFGRGRRSTKGGEHSPPNPAPWRAWAAAWWARSTKGGEHSPPNQDDPDRGARRAQRSTKGGEHSPPNPLWLPSPSPLSCAALNEGRGTFPAKSSLTILPITAPSGLAQRRAGNIPRQIDRIGTRGPVPKLDAQRRAGNIPRQI